MSYHSQKGNLFELYGLVRRVAGRRSQVSGHRSRVKVQATGTCGLKLATCDLRPETCNLRPETCNLEFRKAVLRSTLEFEAGRRMHEENFTGEPSNRQRRMGGGRDRRVRISGNPEQ